MEDTNSGVNWGGIWARYRHGVSFEELISARVFTLRGRGLVI